MSPFNRTSCGALSIYAPRTSVFLGHLKSRNCSRKERLDRGLVGAARKLFGRNSHFSLPFSKKKILRTFNNENLFTNKTLFSLGWGCSKTFRQKNVKRGQKT